FQRLAIFRSELEDVTHFDGALNLEGLATIPAGFTGLNQAQVCPLFDLDVAADRDIAKVKAIFVCAGRHGVRIFEPFIGINRQILDTDSAETPGMRPESAENLLAFGGPELDDAQRTGEFGFIELIVAPHQNEDRLALDDI